MRKLALRSLIVVVGMGLGGGLAAADAFDKLKDGEGGVYRHVASDKKVSENTIASIRLNTEKISGNDQAGVAFTMSVTIGGSSEKFVSSGQCSFEAGQMDCRVACDGSGFFLTAQGEKSIMMMNPEGFQVNGCRKDGKKPRTIKAGDEGPVYDLVRVVN